MCVLRDFNENDRTHKPAAGSAVRHYRLYCSAGLTNYMYYYTTLYPHYLAEYLYLFIMVIGCEPKVKKLEWKAESLTERTFTRRPKSQTPYRKRLRALTPRGRGRGARKI